MGKVAYITRNKSVITNHKTLEHLHTLPNFPIFMGCVDVASEKSDMFADMSFSICKESGIIQLDKVLPLDIVYLYKHNDGIGDIWKNHYSAFVNFIARYSPNRVFEIGGGNGVVANLYLAKNKSAHWTMIEPHPLCSP